MAAIENLGIKGYDGLRFVTLDLERSRNFYLEKLDFGLSAKSTSRWEENTGDRAEVYTAGDIRIEIVEPQRDDSWAAAHRRFHPAGIGKVNFEVVDIEAAWDKLAGRGATFIDEIETFQSDGGTYRHFEIASPMGNLNYGFVERDGYDTYAPGFKSVGDGGDNKFGFTHIDHLTSNVRTLKPLVDWFGDVLGMEQYWDIQFHTSDLDFDDIDDIDPDKVEGSGLKSIVMWDPESGIKFANNEPRRPQFKNSQIQKYVEDFRGGGVQHAAFAMRDIVGSVAELRDRGCSFLDTPQSYYDAAPDRLAEQGVSSIDEDFEELSELGILVDGEEEKYLLQIFMEEAADYYDEPDAGPFFIELIQRKGSQGFGGGNFRALFESIERRQQAQAAS